MNPRPVAPDFRSRSLYKLSSLLALLLANLLVAGLAVLLHLSGYFSTQKELSARQLYDNIWTGVKDNLYDRDKLQSWQRWRHRYDDRIHNEKDALEFARIMVDSLQDPYTFLLNKEQAEQSFRQAVGEQATKPPYMPSIRKERLPGNIGYIRLYTFMRIGVHQQLKEALSDLADCDALIIDLRGNLGGFVHESILAACLFLENGVIWKGEFKSPADPWNVSLQAGLTTNTLQLGIARILPLPLPRQQNLTQAKPIVLLVDGYTASAAEIFAAALQTRKHTVLVGSQTFGKGIAQTFVPVGNGIVLRITNACSYTPDNRWLGDGYKNTNGLKPDVSVPPSYNNNNPLADRTLEAALAKLKEMMLP